MAQVFALEMRDPGFGSQQLPHRRSIQQLQGPPNRRSVFGTITFLPIYMEVQTLILWNVRSSLLLSCDPDVVVGYGLRNTKDLMKEGRFRSNHRKSYIKLHKTHDANKVLLLSMA